MQTCIRLLFTTKNAMLKLRRYFISAIVFCLTVLSSSAQENHKIAVGIDVSKNLSNWALSNYALKKGVAVESVMLYKLNKDFNYKLSLGYSATSQKIKLNDFQDLDYINKGFYIKNGIFFSTGVSDSVAKNVIGLNIVFSGFNELGSCTIHGNYFGDIVQKYTNDNLIAVALEPNFDEVLLKYKRFAMMVNYRMTFVVYSNIHAAYPTYFIPGIGNPLFYSFSDSHYFSIGINLFFIYSL